MIKIFQTFSYYSVISACMGTFKMYESDPEGVSDPVHGFAHFVLCIDDTML